MHEETRVVDKRETSNLSVTRRRRECTRCGRRFTTYERVEYPELVVIKKDGRREKFSREKIMRGIERACEKRPISVEKINEIVDEIEAELRRKDRNEVLSSEIGELVMEKLKKLDEVAYVRFASVYRAFADVSSFVKEVEELLKGGKVRA